MTIQVDCWCMACDAMVREAHVMNGNEDALWQRLFIVCPECGDKRCPRAAHHDHGCTGSAYATITPSAPHWPRRTP